MCHTEVDNVFSVDLFYDAIFANIADDLKFNNNCVFKLLIDVSGCVISYVYKIRS